MLRWFAYGHAAELVEVYSLFKNNKIPLVDVG